VRDPLQSDLQGAEIVEADVMLVLLEAAVKVVAVGL
jgi:hypothetical protein